MCAQECFFESAVTKLKLLKIAMEMEAAKPAVTQLKMGTSRVRESQGGMLKGSACLSAANQQVTHEEEFTAADDAAAVARESANSDFA